MISKQSQRFFRTHKTEPAEQNQNELSFSFTHSQKCSIKLTNDQKPSSPLASLQLEKYEEKRNPHTRFNTSNSSILNKLNIFSGKRMDSQSKFSSDEQIEGHSARSKVKQFQEQLQGLKQQNEDFRKSRTAIFDRLSSQLVGINDKQDKPIINQEKCQQILDAYNKLTIQNALLKQQQCKLIQEKKTLQIRLQELEDKYSLIFNEFIELKKLIQNDHFLYPATSQFTLEGSFTEFPNMSTGIQIELQSDQLKYLGKENKQLKEDIINLKAEKLNDLIEKDKFYQSIIKDFKLELEYYRDKEKERKSNKQFTFGDKTPTLNLLVANKY